MNAGSDWPSSRAFASATRRGQPLNLLEAVRQVGNEAFQNV
jgi:hypothetical protein